MIPRPPQTGPGPKRLSAPLTHPVDEFQMHDHHRPDRRGVFGRDVKSDHAPTASRDDGAVLVAKEVKAVDFGTRDRIADRFVVHRRTSGVRASYWLPSYQCCKTPPPEPRREYGATKAP